MEIERKFLLCALPVGLTDGVEIRQGYLATGDPEVRVRSKGSKFFVTRKGGEGLVRSEDEIQISQEVFEILWSATEGKRIEKIRYNVLGPDGLVWEVDEYLGSLKGLFTAEVEIPTETTGTPTPTEIGRVFIGEVTLDKRFKNKRLATEGIPS